VRLLNSTHWQTADLARIVRRVAAEELNPNHTRAFTVYVRYNRGGDKSTYSSGCAPVHGNWIRVMVPSGAVDPVDFAHVVAHEFAHARGMEHKDMRGSRRYQRVAGYRDFYAWAADMPITKRQQAPRPTVEDRRDARFAHAVAKVLEWETKLKRTQTALKKWRRKAAAVERQINIAASRKESGA
jgi:hypothetical protein